jgi:DNA polymerase-3 subunit chi
MARVDFYVLDRVDERSRQLLACKLAEKAYRLKNTVYIHAKSAADASHLDELLWTFRDGSFLPHLPVDDAAAADPEGETPVLVGHGGEPGPQHELLINLADDVPLFFSRFDRVAEIVTGDAADAARDRFRFYRDRGYELNTHKL